MSEYAIIVDNVVVSRLVCKKAFAQAHIKGLANAEISDSVDAKVGTVKQGDSFVKPVESRSAAEAKRAKRQEIDTHRKSLFYSDIEVAFPTGNKTIKFGNENDRQNLLDVVISALSLKVDGKGSDNVTFITFDNKIQTLSADDMVTVGNFVLANKKALVYEARSRKDAVNKLTEDQTLETELDKVDVKTGWPS